MIKYFTILFSLIVLGESCKKKAAEPVFDTFDELASRADKVIIERKYSPEKDSITDFFEIRKFRELIKESKKSKDCYSPTGTIRFLNKGEDCGFIEFGITSDCAAFYLYFEGKPTTYKMSYRCGMFINEL